MGKITCFESGIGGFYLCTPASGHKGNFVNCVCSSQRKMQALENTTELPSLDLSVRARLMRQRLLVKRRYFTYFFRSLPRSLVWPLVVWLLLTYIC